MASLKSSFSCFALSVILLISCGDKKETAEEKSQIPGAEKETQLFQKDLEEIVKDGKLKAITIYSSTSYFLYRGQAMGYEYELLQRLAANLNLDLEIVVAKDVDQLITMLNRGDADIIAHGLTITNDRKEKIAFTEHLYLTKQVLVQRKPDNWRQMKLHEIDQTLIQDASELIGETVSVRPNSSYYSRLIHLEEEMGGHINLDTSHPDIATDKLIEMLVEGEIQYTVADKNIAEINASYYDNLDIETPVSFSQRIAWGIRKNSPQLLDTINQWLEKMKKRTEYFVIYDKYYKNKRSYKKRVKSEYFSSNTGKISQYDEIIKTHSKNINWDWRFVSALVYQESQFNNNAKSWASAQGLMQIMPATARDLGVKNVLDANQNIRGGTKYLNQIYDMWESIPDSIQRLKFTLASYNCGFYHVMDATRLAEKYKHDPLVWDDNVETYVLNLSYSKYYRDEVVKYGYARGREPVKYVQDIFERYEEYKQFIEE